VNSRVATLRKAKGWTQADLAEKLDVSRQTVNAIETERYEPSLSLAFKIAAVFGQRIEDVFLPATGNGRR
jgi:putative transcriptional regulator